MWNLWNWSDVLPSGQSRLSEGDFVLHRLTFPKLAPPKAGGEPYAEWPISVSVSGRYHNLAILFSRLSNFSRIMSVEQISISALANQVDRTITSDFVAKTFVYVEPKEPEPTEKDKKKP